jgi:adenosylcobinamide-GDP ribazoletransferase
MIQDGVRLAIGTLTAVPVKAPRTVDRSSARVAMIVAPLAVLPIAVAAGAVGELGALVRLPPFVLAVLILATFALGSRGLHLDGLADTADGLTASYNRERALDIMGRGNTGPAGAAALILVLLLQAGALTSVLTRPWGVLCGVGLLCLARSSLLVACLHGIPAARPAGLGATVAGVVPRFAALLGGLGAAAVAAWLLFMSQRPWWQGVVSVAVAACASGVLVLRCRKRFGGITGDVLGASIEIAAAGLLVAAAAG